MIHQVWLLVALTILAVARLTRLVTADVLLMPARRWVIRHRPPPSDPALDDDWLVYLIHCRWCASIWIAIPTAGAVYAWHAYWPVQVLLIALAASHLTALLAGLEDD